jgi:hypothetical protein
VSAEHEHAPKPPDGGCGDAAIYLLGLLDEHQTRRFREHAETCAICRDEIGALRPAVDVLPATMPQLDAPEHVKRSVMAVVHAEARREVRSSRSADALRADASQAGVSRAGVSLDGASRAGALLDRASRSRWRRLMPRHGVRRPALVLASAALLAGGVAIGALSTSGSSGGGAARVIDADVTIAGASAALHEDGGHNVLTVAGLPQPRAGRVYEVWVKHRGGLPQPTSSLFTPTNSGAATVAVPSDLGTASEVMVTQEPAGGSALPTTAPVIVARVS